MWFFGKSDLDNVYNVTESNKFVIPIITKAFKNIFEYNPT